MMIRQSNALLSACERVGSHASHAQIARSGAIPNLMMTTVMEHRRAFM
jgi:hypothetical protein